MNYLRKLFSYDRWANAQYVNALSTFPQKSYRELRLLSHIVAAQMLWMDRIKERSARAPVWPEWNLEEYSRYCQQSAEEWRSLVASLDENRAQESWLTPIPKASTGRVALKTLRCMWQITERIIVRKPRRCSAQSELLHRIPTTSKASVEDT